MGNKVLAELIGILLGDGSIGVYKCKSKNKISFQHRVKITLDSNNDLEYSGYIKDILQKIFHLEPKIRFRRNENTLDILYFNKKVVEFLINKVGLNLSPKWEKAKIPNQFLNSELELYVIRGYFDTDGCVVITNNNGIVYPRLEMKICPSPMQKQFIDILKRNDFRFGVYKIGKGKVRIQMNGKKQLEKWYNLIGSSNPKHIRKFKKFLNGSGSRI